MYKLFSVGARTEPYSTPACIPLGVDNSPSAETQKFLFVNNELIGFIKFAEKCNINNLYNKPVCHVVPNSSSMSKNTATVLKLRVT